MKKAFRQLIVLLIIASIIGGEVLPVYAASESGLGRNISIVQDDVDIDSVSGDSIEATDEYTAASDEQDIVAGDESETDGSENNDEDYSAVDILDSDESQEEIVTEEETIDESLVEDVFDVEITNLGSNSRVYEYGGSKYQVFSGNHYSWTEAERFCESLGGHLATITSQEEQDFVISITDSYSCWLGGYLSEYYEWNWITGETWDYTNWGDIEPNNAGNDEFCLALRLFEKWNDLDVSSYEQSGFVCEWDEYKGPFIWTFPEINDGNGWGSDDKKDYSEVFEYNGNKYQIFYSSHYSWIGAECYCEGLGGHLATITDNEERDFIMSISEEDRLLIGGFLFWDNSWRWVTGEEFEFCPDEFEMTDECSWDITNRKKSSRYLLTDMENWCDIETTASAVGFICEWDGYSDNHSWHYINGYSNTEYDYYFGKIPVYDEPAPFIFDDFNDSRYQVFFGDSFSWIEAEHYCESLGGHLATITTQEEDDFINDFYSGSAWLGGYIDNDNTLNWVTDETWNYRTSTDYSYNFMERYNCIAKIDDDWGSYPNDGRQRAFICEWDDYYDKHKWFSVNSITSDFMQKDFLFDYRDGILEIRPGSNNTILGYINCPKEYTDVKRIRIVNFDVIIGGNVFKDFKNLEKIYFSNENITIEDVYGVFPSNVKLMAYRGSMVDKYAERYGYVLVYGEGEHDFIDYSNMSSNEIKDMVDKPMSLGKHVFEGHVYEAFTESMTWGEAERYCESIGGHLVTITSDDEMHFVNGLGLGHNRYWLGAISPAGQNYALNNCQWVWITGEMWWYVPSRDIYGWEFNPRLEPYQMDSSWTYYLSCMGTNWDEAYSPQSHNTFKNYFVCEWDDAEEYFTYKVLRYGEEENLRDIYWDAIAEQGIMPGASYFYWDDPYNEIAQYVSLYSDGRIECTDFLCDDFEYSGEAYICVGEGDRDERFRIKVIVDSVSVNGSLEKRDEFGGLYFENSDGNTWYYEKICEFGDDDIKIYDNIMDVQGISICTDKIKDIDYKVVYEFTGQNVNSEYIDYKLNGGSYSLPTTGDFFYRTRDNLVDDLYKYQIKRPYMVDDSKGWIRFSNGYQDDMQDFHNAYYDVDDPDYNKELNYLDYARIPKTMDTRMYYYIDLGNNRDGEWDWTGTREKDLGWFRDYTRIKWRKDGQLEEFDYQFRDTYLIYDKEENSINFTGRNMYSYYDSDYRKFMEFWDMGNKVYLDVSITYDNGKVMNFSFIPCLSSEYARDEHYRDVINKGTGISSIYEYDSFIKLGSRDDENNFCDSGKINDMIYENYCNSGFPVLLDKGYYATVADNISLHCSFGISDLANADDLYITIVSDGPEAPEVKRVADLPYQNGNYLVDIEVTPKEIDKEYTIQLYDPCDESLGDPINVSVYGYASAILKGSYSKETKEVVADLLLYGKSAKDYFSYDGYGSDIDWTLVNQYSSSSTFQEAFTELSSSGVYSFMDNLAGVDYLGTSLTLKSGIGMNIYFNVEPGYSIDDYSFTVNNQDYDIRYDESHGCYCVKIQNIKMSQLKDAYLIKVSGENGAVLSLSYSVNTYIRQALFVSGDSGLVDLCQRLYFLEKAINKIS